MKAGSSASTKFCFAILLTCSTGLLVQAQESSGTAGFKRLDKNVDPKTGKPEMRLFHGDHSEVVLIEIDGGGHTWPGQKPIVSALGESTMDISANDLMWEFFRKHPRQRTEQVTQDSKQ